ncbi:hypothetical protein PFICI_05783 [Pestalotiopsis fici W106-1]|uniref:C2H2-type domain-containing protein n=1 Tax=Pestalotiopsis fici (strain W106-1 / CGMCC3.15140) TaxID=1229662 RepID=W3XES3_PESFW|nr:uncharacterized protein PFICI_05783 [Pestalotiopsis fici W106-1]ETS83907.1 hypothetical protein PFICI_05783 [Pestalotiopsis fici W106-1]
MASVGLNAGGGDVQTDTALREALNQFRKKISDGHLSRFQTGTAMKLKYECYLIQRDQERMAALSNFRRIEQFLFRLQELQVILKKFSNGEFYISYIWGAMQFLLQTATSTFKDGSDGLLSAYESIGKNIPKLKDLEPLFIETTGMRKCLVALYSDILDFHSGAYQCFTQFSDKGRKKIFKSAWKEFEKNDMSYLEGRMRKHKTVVEYGQQCLAGQPSPVQESSLSPNDITDLRSKVFAHENDCNKEEEEHNRRESERREDQFGDALRWILADQNTSDATHERLCKDRMKFPGTCEWIDDVDSVGNWLDPKSTSMHPILWINGSMGAGKSTLASYLVEKCVKNETSAGTPCKATYFYCDGKDPTARTFLAISRGLLYRQLMHIREEERFRHLIAHCCDKKSNSGQQYLNAEETAESLLKTFFEIIPGQYIVVDGLDECEKPVIKDTLRTLSSVVTQQDTIEPGSLRLLIISRELPEIKKPLSTESANAGIFKIEAEHNEAAIKMYVGQRLADFDPRFDLNIDMKKYIIKKISDTAEGMFLFARLTLDHLEGSVSRADLDHRLEDGHFPKTIHEAYNRLLENLKKSLDSEQWNKAKCIFGWLTCAMRTLHWHEIRAIASIERHNESVELQQHGFIPDVQKFCGTLVHVNPGNKVELIHLTAHRYILESEHVSKEEVQFDLATLCMEYLTFPCFNKGILVPLRKSFASDGFYAFQDYAVSQWFYHIAEVLKIQELTIDGPKSQKFAEVLVVFMDRYRDSVDDVDAAPSSAGSEPSHIDLEEVKVQAKTDCASLEGRPFYKILFDLWVHVSKHEKEGIENRNKPCLKEMEKVLEDNRKAIEALGEAKNERPQNLYEYYGKNLYKCPRTRCDYFHEGLKDEKQRKRHIARHDRPFMCTAPGCTMAEAGFISNKDLERHKKNYHSDAAEGQSPFPQRNNRQSSEARFDCRICKKKFTRKINLDGHMRSHFGDRPYSCQTCNRRFTRLNDLRRHERLHLRR